MYAFETLSTPPRQVKQSHIATGNAHNTRWENAYRSGKAH